MSEQTTLPPPGRQFADQPFAYDPVRQPDLFDGVIFKRTIAFIIDAIIITLLTVAAYAVVALLYGATAVGYGLATHRLRRS